MALYQPWHGTAVMSCKWCGVHATVYQPKLQGEPIELKNVKPHDPQLYIPPSSELYDAPNLNQLQSFPPYNFPVMATIPAILCFLFLLYFLCVARKNKDMPMREWPLLGMVPGVVQNADRIHDYLAHVLNRTGGTFAFRGPWFAGFNVLITCDPANLHYILAKQSSNFPKGPGFAEIFDILGDGIFNAVSESWKLQRKITATIINSKRFMQLAKRTTRDKIEKGLLPVLENVGRHKLEIDLQELFKRFTFDNICQTLFGFDPATLSTELPEIPSAAAAIEDIERALLYRNILPPSVWKLQNWLQLGEERKMSRAIQIQNQFFTKSISLAREKEETLMDKDDYDAGEFPLLEAFFKEATRMGAPSSFTKPSDKFVMDVALNLLSAGRDTVAAALAWFFYLVASNPSVETNIRKEIQANFPQKELRQEEEEASTSRLVYLHASLCEALRLYPTVPYLIREAVESGMLPSGHRFCQNTRIVMLLHSMGRMEDVWGKDCLKFKPERWITACGEITHVPSNKFPAFGTGPKSCVGKELSFTQIKMVAIAVLREYEIRLVKESPISPSCSVVLDMQKGVKVKITKFRGGENK